MSARALERLIAWFNIAYQVGLDFTKRIFPAMAPWLEQTDERRTATSPSQNTLKLPNIDRTIKLPDGRDLSCAKYGASEGPVIFHFHGFPGSRLEGSLYHDAATALGIQVLTVDRPGVGLSSPHPNRSPRTFADDVQYLAQHLDLKSYAVMAISGGGPYALAYAHAHPEGLKAVALVAAMGPHDVSRKGMSWANRILFHGFQHYPRVMGFLVPYYVRRVASLSEDVIVDAVRKLQDPSIPLWLKPKPREMKVLIYEKVMRTFWRSSREFSRQGFQVYCDEGRILTSNQGFKSGGLRDEIPLRLWYGTEDANLGAQMGPRIASGLGRHATLRMEDEGHASLVVNRAEDVLRDLKQFL